MRGLLILLMFFCLNGYTQTTILWQKKSSLPSFPRQDFASFIIDSNYYVIGGLDSVIRVYSEVWRYTITSDHWERLGDFPGGPIREPQGFALNNKGYILTGVDSITQYECDDEFWQYDPLIDVWNHKANFPGGKRQGAMAFADHKNGYLAFGRWCAVKFANDLWKYDVNSDSWILLSDTLPGKGRTYCTNTVIDSSVYFIGGHPVNSNKRLGDFWRYDLFNQTWNSLDTIPGLGREGCLLFGFKDFLIAGYGAYEFGLLHDCYKYTFSNHTWTGITFQNFPDSTSGNQNNCFQYKDQVFFFSGFKKKNSYYTDLWSFDATPLIASGIEDVKEKLPLDIHPNPISSHGTLTLSSGQPGTIEFYNSIGQLLYSSHLDAGSNRFECDLLHCEAGVVFYRTVYKDGIAENGKLLLY